MDAYEFEIQQKRVVQATLLSKQAKQLEEHQIFLTEGIIPDEVSEQVRQNHPYSFMHQDVRLQMFMERKNRWEDVRIPITRPVVNFFLLEIQRQITDLSEQIRAL